MSVYKVDLLHLSNIALWFLAINQLQEVGFGQVQVYRPKPKFRTCLGFESLQTAHLLNVPLLYRLGPKKFLLLFC